MAIPYACAHSFKMIKSDNTLLQWTGQLCHSGPHLNVATASCTHVAPIPKVPDQVSLFAELSRLLPNRKVANV